MQALRKNLIENKLPIFILNGHGYMDTRFENMITLKDNQYVIFFTKPGCSLNGSKCPGVNKKFTNILTNPNKTSILRNILMRNKNIKNNNKPNIFKNHASFNPLLIYGPGDTVYNHEIVTKPENRNLGKEMFGVYTINSNNKVTKNQLRNQTYQLKNVLREKDKGVFILPICRLCSNNQYKNVKATPTHKNEALYYYLTSLNNNSYRNILRKIFSPENYQRINRTALKKINTELKLINFIKKTKFQFTKEFSNFINKNAQTIAKERASLLDASKYYLSPENLNRIAGPAAAMNWETQNQFASNRVKNGNATSFTRNYLKVKNRYVSGATSKRKRSGAPQPNPPNKRR
jgi:hypothetical protein